MSSFDLTAFLIVAAAIGIAGAFYPPIKDSITAGWSSLSGTQPTTTGGSRRYRKRCHKNTKRRH